MSVLDDQDPREHYPALVTRSRATRRFAGIDPAAVHAEIQSMYETHEKPDAGQARDLPTPTPDATGFHEVTAATDGGSPEGGDGRTRKDELNAVESTLEISETNPMPDNRRDRDRARANRAA